MGNCNKLISKIECSECCEKENKIKLLNNIIIELQTSIEIKNANICILEQKIHILEKYY